MAELKQRARWRLLGALVFLMAMTALAMAILRDRPRPLAHEFVLRMPSSEAAADASAGLGSAAAVVPGLAEGRAPAPAAEPAPSVVSEVAPASAPASAPTSAPTSAPAAASAAAPAPAVPPKESPAKADAEDRSWLVQVGAYGNEKTARAVAKRVASAGPTDVSEVKTANGSRWRVRVGPFSRKDAEDFRDRAKAQRYEAVLVKAGR